MTKKEQLKALIEKLKKMPRPALIRSIAAVCVLVFALAAGIDVTYTWLSSRYEAASFSIFTGTTDSIPVTAWTYRTTKEGDTNGGSWVPDVADISVEGFNKLSGSNTETTDQTDSNGNTYSSTSYSVKSLKMGSITNLMNATDDNIVYLIFEIGREENGESFTLDIDQPADSISLYYTPSSGTNKGQQQQVNNNAVMTSLQAINANYGFVNLKYALSDTKYEPGSTGFNTNLTFETMSPQSTTAINTYQLTGTAPASNSSVYYLYIQMSPTLLSFGKAARHLYQYMPCEMFFDWNILLEVH